MFYRIQLFPHFSACTFNALTFFINVMFSRPVDLAYSVIDPGTHAFYSPYFIGHFGDNVDRDAHDSILF